MVGKLFGKLRRPREAKDPVCHMMIDVNDPPGGTIEYLGATYYFCGRGCRLNFEEDPAGYLSGEKREEM